jgi:membrane protease YdiL (CAAX protease family)
MRVLRPAVELRALLAYSLVFVLWSAVTGLAIRLHPMRVMGASHFTEDYLYVFAFKIPGLLLIPALWFIRSDYTVRDLLRQWRWERRTVLLTVFAFLAGVYVNANHTNLAQVSAIAASMRPIEVVIRLGWALLIPLISAGIPEEFVFRGLLQTRMEAAWGRIAAILGTAILFAGWHLPTRFILASGAEGRAGDFGSVLLHTGLPVFVVGLIFGVLWDRYRRLIPLIALHWGIDLLPALSSLFGIAT